MGKRIAVIGSGISGLSAAYHLREQAEVTLYEAGSYFGGHTHTVDVTLPSPQGMVTYGVDTGFLVFNERTYPGLIRLFTELQVQTSASDMSFSVQTPGASGQRAMEWSGSNLNTVFAQRSNLFNPTFLGMLRDVLRFNTLANALADRGEDHALMQPLGEFLEAHKFGHAFRHWYLLPMLGCIWSCPTDQMLQFPVATMVRFCHNHGLIQVVNRPQWFTVTGGAKHYVEKLLPHIPHAHLQTPVQRIERNDVGTLVYTASGSEVFDAIVLACHADQALSLLAQPTPQEQTLLGAIRYHPNRAVLHTDTSVMPKKKLAWAAWNYERAPDLGRESSRVCLHYWINRLQPLPFSQDVIVSLNPVSAIDPSKVLGEYDYAHPVFDLGAIQAQSQLATLQGQQNTWYAGTWMGYGFHEDGFKAGREAALDILAA
ncbi:MAG: FAD-dependent oxidoreductase [Betaproteobacteria bacterium]|nr:FAD-dependent oxidoreductase [Betaproteobacteria bacterium]